MKNEAFRNLIFSGYCDFSKCGDFYPGNWDFRNVLILFLRIRDFILGILKIIRFLSVDRGFLPPHLPNLGDICKFFFEDFLSSEFFGDGDFLGIGIFSWNGIFHQKATLTP